MKAKKNKNFNVNNNKTIISEPRIKLLDSFKSEKKIPEIKFIILEASGNLSAKVEWSPKSDTKNG